MQVHGLVKKATVFSLFEVAPGLYTQGFFSQRSDRQAVLTLCFIEEILSLCGMMHMRARKLSCVSPWKFGDEGCTAKNKEGPGCRLGTIVRMS
jgi:hypothetical protein